MQGDLALSELNTFLLNCLLIPLNVAELSQALADLYNMQGDFKLYLNYLMVD